MILQEVPRKDWETFCDAFSSQHEDWLISISTVETDLLDEITPEAERNMSDLARDIALRRMTVQEVNGKTVLSIYAGENQSQPVHRVDEPSRIMFEKTEEGADEGLRISDSHKKTTLVHFRAAESPENVNGFAEM